MSKDLCDTHYRWMRLTGDPTPKPKSALSRFLDHIGEQDSTDVCWEWLGSRFGTGYGRFKTNGLIIGAHRYAYELLVGPIPEGLTIDHLCRNRACVNPAHLEPVTFKENVLRGENMAARYARRDRCSRGHLFDGPDGYIRKDGGRGCRACNRIRREEKRSHG